LIFSFLAIVVVQPAAVMVEPISDLRMMTMRADRTALESESVLQLQLSHSLELHTWWCDVGQAIRPNYHHQMRLIHLTDKRQ
jgi:hypothetical protein